MVKGRKMEYQYIIAITTFEVNDIFLLKVSKVFVLPCLFRGICPGGICPGVSVRGVHIGGGGGYVLEPV